MEMPTKKEMSLTDHEQKHNYVTEYQNYEDDAWYVVMVTLQEKETLQVSYKKFNDVYKNLFPSSLFHSLEELHEFEKRFRPVSVQAQDYECHKLVHGVRVCASVRFNSNGLRFYDAVVDTVGCFIIFSFFLNVVLRKF
ncbi:putative SAWADEE domain-containing protein [Medicago truncatula]|uniref:Putative SAWADEE domain-containing protein n=1 Tax=Medicago truncatula TaxID=3880 RepID=A0A396HF86_MEDTR|nr:putative SAWADEE domain-containing protein [Medicago truncatula]